MSTTPNVGQPPAPPTVPPVPPTARFDANGDPVGTAQVTRNVPPKRVMVLPGNTVTYAGTSYAEGDSFLIGEGPVADNLVLQGHVTIVDHEQVKEWNGKEGDEIRKRALAIVDAQHEADGTERTHDHGFGKYQHADGADAEPSEHTTFRQQAAAEQVVRGTTHEEYTEAQKQRRGGQ